MNVLGHSCFEYLEEKRKLFTRKLSNIMILYRIYKTTLRYVKTTTLYLYLEQELHSDEMFNKACVQLGGIFGDRN